MKVRMVRSGLVALLGTLSAMGMLVVAEPAKTSSSAKVDATPQPVVSIKGMQFQPATLTVQAGATVVWKNLDEEPHTVASTTGVFRSGALDENDRYTQKFDKPGTYPYLCAIHPQMIGTIIVK